jgi:hypothetical protein
MHYIIIITIIAVIVALQIKSFVSTSKKLETFKTIFANTNGAYNIFLRKVSVAGELNPVLKEIVESINNYLSNNKGGNDFHLMKNIVDRNCDAKEEEISAQIPVPLYLGLTGTMIGILTGIAYLVFSGSLNDLLTGKSGTSAEGMQTLLVGVALAMTSSILGIWLTTMASSKVKKCKVEFERNKNIFLSWIQARLLPTLSDNVSVTLERMSQNLAEFNNTFASNILQLNQTFDTVSKLLEEIDNLKITDITTANIKVYNSLKNCTAEIGQFTVYMQNVNSYLTNVQALNRKLDEYERRTQVIEKAGQFYDKNEKWLSESIDSANLEVADALKRFKETMIGSLNKLQDSMNGQILDFNEIMKRQQQMLLKQSQETSELVLSSLRQVIAEQISGFNTVITDQQKMLQEKSAEISGIVTELKNLTAVKTSMQNIEKATVEQNEKIDRLAQSIEKLAQAKAGKNIRLIIPKLIKITLLVAGGIIIIVGLAYIISIIN